MSITKLQQRTQKLFCVFFSNSVTFNIALFFSEDLLLFLPHLSWKIFLQLKYMVCISTLCRKWWMLWNCDLRAPGDIPPISLLSAGWCLTFHIGIFIILTRGFFFFSKIGLAKGKIYLREVTHLNSISHAHFSMN